MKEEAKFSLSQISILLKVKVTTITRSIERNPGFISFLLFFQSEPRKLEFEKTGILFNSENVQPEEFVLFPLKTIIAGDYVHIKARGSSSRARDIQ